MEKNIKISRACVLSAIVTVIFIAASTILAEIYPAFKDFLAKTFYHHWVGKSLLAVFLFLLGFPFFLLISKKSDLDRLENAISAIFWVSVAAVVTIALFFIFHFLGFLV